MGKMSRYQVLSYVCHLLLGKGELVCHGQQRYRAIKAGEFLALDVNGLNGDKLLFRPEMVDEIQRLSYQGPRLEFCTLCGDFQGLE